MRTKCFPAFLAVVAGVLVAALLTTGCHDQKLAQVPANAVAVVGNQVITVESFQHELSRRGPLSPGRSVAPTERQALLEELIRGAALHQKALAAGYDRDEQIAANLRRMIIAKYQEDQIARLPTPKISAEEITNFYTQHPERFGRSAKSRAAIIEINVARTVPPEKRADVAKQAASLRALALAAPSADGTFGALAQQHSEDQSSRYRGGDIGWFSPGGPNPSWPGAVINALFQLQQPGEISPVLETPTAFYLIKLTAKQPAEMQPLAEVRAGIAYLVAREKKQQQEAEFYTSAKNGLPIRINQALLDTIPLPAKAAPPPALPGVATLQPRSTP